MGRRFAGVIVLGLVLGFILGCGPEGSEQAGEASGTTPSVQTSQSDATAGEATSVEVESSVPAEYVLPPSLRTDDVETFLGRASGLLVVRSPELVTYLGLGAALGLGNGELMPLTLAYERETQAMEAAIARRLLTYDLEGESESTRMNARVYGWQLQNAVEGHRFSDHVYLINPYITSYPSTLERLLTHAHPFRSERDVRDYLQRLSQIEARYEELAQVLERSEALHAIPPAFILEQSLDSLRETADMAPLDSPLYSTLVDKLPLVEGMDEARLNEILTEAERILSDSVLPATDRLLRYIEDMMERAPEEGGVWQHVDGDEYYAYRLRSYTTTDLSAEEIHQIGLDEVERIQSEIRRGAATLGMEADLTMTEVFAQIEDEAGSLTGDETAEYCEGLLDRARALVEPVFGRTPASDLVVAGGSASAFYSAGTLDGSRPGRFFAPTAVSTPIHELPTLTYHEAIPGHHFQVSLAHELGLPEYRAGLSFTAYAEGWALYAEQLMSELGAYADDPYGNLGRLQAELFRAARLVVDTGIHANRWTYQEAVDYMIANTGLEEEFVEREVVRYTILPGQATAYKIGMLKLVELRKRAESALGDAFSLPDFHDAVLLEGSVPLSILEELVDAFIERSLPSSS